MLRQGFEFLLNQTLVFSKFCALFNLIPGKLISITTNIQIKPHREAIKIATDAPFTESPTSPESRSTDSFSTSTVSPSSSTASIEEEDDEKKFWRLVMSSKKRSGSYRRMGGSQAGTDYPNYKSQPKSSFSCTDVNQPGFYADEDSGCQAYHRCDNNGGKYSFFCTEGTLFSQLLLVCDHWYNVNCKE